MHDLTNVWRTFSFILLGAIVAFNVIFWPNIRVFTHHVLHDDYTTLNKRFIEAKSHDFMKRASASAIIVWSTQFEKNSRTSLLFDSVEYGRIPQFEDLHSSIFSINYTENMQYIQMLNSQILCEPLNTTSIVGEALESHNLKFLCRAPIIGYDGVMYGYITLAYSTIPSLRDQDIIKDQLKMIARDIYDKSA
jgi:hypothetical protein